MITSLTTRRAHGIHRRGYRRLTGQDLHRRPNIALCPGRRGQTRCSIPHRNSGLNPCQYVGLILPDLADRLVHVEIRAKAR